MMTRSWSRPALLLAATLPFLACENANKLTIRRSRDAQELNSYRVKSFTGIRDGERFFCEVVLGDNDGTLTMQMKFQVGVPTKLDSGTYDWKRKDVQETQGSVKATAVSFQGGQDSPPSLGGTFQLVAKDVPDVSLYEVKLPSTRVDAPGKMPPPVIPSPRAPVPPEPK